MKLAPESIGHPGRVGLHRASKTTDRPCPCFPRHEYTSVRVRLHKRPPPQANTFDSYGYNLIENTTDGTINQKANPGTDITGVDLVHDNGGPTWSIALLPRAAKQREQADVDRVDAQILAEYVIGIRPHLP